MINGEIRMQNADPNRMRCRDCIYRDKDTLEIEGKTVQTGIARATCLIFNGEKGNWKPNEVYFNNANCPLYEFDETADRFWEKKA